MMSSSPPPQSDESRSTPVSPWTVPLLAGGLITGFFSGYLLGWWGALVVLIVVLGAFTAVLSGRDRDGALAAIIGVLLGYVLVLAVAAFRGVF